MAITYSIGNPIVVTGTVDMEDIYNAAYTNGWVDSNGDPVVESPVEGMYFLRVNLEIGDGSTATTLSSLNEMVYFDDGVTLNTNDNATVTLGQLVEGIGNSGSSWSFGPSANLSPFADGTVNIYGSMITMRTGYRLYIIPDSGTFTDSIINFTKTWNDYFHPGDVTFNRGIITFADSGGTIEPSPSVPTINDLLTNVYSIGDYITTSWTITGFVWSNSTNRRAYKGKPGTIAFLDSTEILTPLILDASGVIEEQYTINIHIADKDGANLSGATVNLYGSDSSAYDTAAWSEDSVTTTADGIISEQTVTAKKWVGISATETDYNVFKLVVSKAGYKTLTLENITIDGPIDWHLELQPIEHPPGAWRF